MPPLTAHPRRSDFGFGGAGPLDRGETGSVVQTLALALHELATNARKHSALAATNQGRLSVTWRVRDVAAANGAAPRWLALEWIEEGTGLGWPRQGMAAARCGHGGGYGRQLIERALPYALGAKTHHELTEAGGVRCTIDLPLDRPPQRGGGREKGPR